MLQPQATRLQTSILAPRLPHYVLYVSASFDCIAQASFYKHFELPVGLPDIGTCYSVGVRQKALNNAIKRQFATFYIESISSHPVGHPTCLTTSPRNLTATLRC
jgi:hypothetical protein